VEVGGKDDAVDASVGVTEERRGPMPLRGAHVSYGTGDIEKIEELFERLTLEGNIGIGEQPNIETERVLDVETRCVRGGTQKIELAHDMLLSRPSDEGARAALTAFLPSNAKEKAAGPAK
jgi:hypothetical protein